MSSAADEGVARPRRKKHKLPLWLETILLLVLALALAVLLKTFVVQAFYIPSQSMEPGLVRNDRILVQKVSYWGDDGPERGDVIVFEDPAEWLGAGDLQGPTSPIARTLAKIGLYPEGGHLVKRVIGVAGDAISCCDDEGRLSVNGYALDESDYVMQDGTSCAAPQVGCRLTLGPIPEGYLFVMGDNRGKSSDSTAHLCQDPGSTECSPTQGLVPVELVVGKVFALVWPYERWDRVTRPGVFDDIPDP